MKLKYLLGAISLGLFSSVFATNIHTNPKADSVELKAAAKHLSYPGYCQIEIINDSLTDVHVFGTFDDGAMVDFYIYRYEAPHYINLNYYGYCHSGMNLTIYTPYQIFYSGWTSVDTTLRMVPYLKNQVKAELSTR